MNLIPPFFKVRGDQSSIPIPDSRFPIPDSRFPIPYSLLPTPYSLLPYQITVTFPNARY
ncbi:MAG: hypothetical protein F6J94_07110 [Moorea sp. SIO1F2]|uniref:hypothetical protein n=1 Tax=Moorena sp. SIO1F2 TaxID=2607819 RepID=UPI0013B6551D|nr:hypothetical protein [Moorena sp. SIO1F2]NET81730.1 hypothetical protein [Moorena sp. SIO1F2]